MLAVLVGCTPEFVELHWVVSFDDDARSKMFGHPELKLKIPAGYVISTIGEDIKSREKSHIIGNGLYSVTLNGPRTPVESDVEIGGHIMLEAGYDSGGGRPALELLRYQAQKLRAYRLEDGYGLERFQRIECATPPGPEFDPAAPHASLPEGCRIISREEEMFGEDEGIRVWMTCPGASLQGRCIMRTTYRRWGATVLFDKRGLPQWRGVRAAMNKFLDQFSS